MRRLYLKIFLWFGIGVLVVSGTLVTLTELSHSRADDDRRWQSKYTPRVHMWSRQQVDILAREGPDALRRYIGSIEYDPGVSNYVFDRSGRDVLGRVAPPVLAQAAASTLSASDGSVLVDTLERFIAEKTSDADGHPYVVMVDYPSPSVLNRSLFEFLSADGYPGAVDAKDAARVAGVLAVAGLFCFLLARHIAYPIERLRAATRLIGDEQLSTRVEPAVVRRRDEIADLGRDFDRMAERIEHLVTAQRDLLADVSHALRSPLARLGLALGLMKRETGGAHVEHLDRIELELDRLNRLIGQLLQMARVDSGVDLERRSLFDLGTVLEEVSTDADYEARSRQCSVRLDQQGVCIVDGSREMLRGAVENVVRNAVRHTADRTVVDISMRCLTGDGGARATIEVRDCGPGVPDDSVGRLFSPFQRVEKGPQAADRIGLGLAIARRTFEVHGGRASAANAPGGGFLVTLELPVRIAS